MNPQRLAVFSAVVQAGSISKAALRLGCGKSVISRQLTKLEAELGTRLIQRSTRRLALTEVGALVFQETQQIERALANIEQMAGQYQQEVRGSLRVACPLPMGHRHLVPLIAAFTAQFPNVDVTLMVEDRLVDLIAEQVDVAVRIGHLADSTLIACKLADNPRVLVAAPAYLSRAGMPQNPADLAKHQCVVFARDGHAYNEWFFTDGATTVQARVQGRMRTDNGMALAAAVRAGLGMTVLDRLLVTEELQNGELVEVLAGYAPLPGAAIYAVYPARDWLARKTSSFITFLQDHLFNSDQ